MEYPEWIGYTSSLIVISAPWQPRIPADISKPQWLVEDSLMPSSDKLDGFNTFL
jgi:hypothetical protein